MTAPTRDTAYLDQQITAALAALRGARAACDRSPNAETIAAEERCEERLDWLLGKRSQVQAESAPTDG